MFFTVILKQIFLKDHKFCLKFVKKDQSDENHVISVDPDWSHAMGKPDQNKPLPSNDVKISVESY